MPSAAIVASAARSALCCRKRKGHRLRPAPFFVYESQLINRDWQAAVGQCPLCPQKRTFVSALSMSALCQKRTPDHMSESRMLSLWCC